MTRRRKCGYCTKQTNFPNDNTRKIVEVGREIFYIGERLFGEDAYIFLPSPKHSYPINMWYERGNGEISYVIVRTPFNPTAASLFYAASIAYRHFRLSIDPPVLNVNLPQSDVISVGDKKYFWCDMTSLVVVVPYINPIETIPADNGIWRDRTVVMIDEEEHFWRGGRWEDCYWVIREKTTENPEEKIGGTIETIRLLQSEMKYTRDAYKWYKALSRIKQALNFLLAFLPLALFETKDNRFVVELATHNQELRLRAIVPST